MLRTNPRYCFVQKQLSWASAVWMWRVFHLFKDPIQADNQTDTIHQNPNENQTYQGQLRVTNAVPDATFKRGKLAVRSWKLVVPGYTTPGRTWDGRGEEVVKTQGKGSRPGADKDGLQ